jgi:hypothetical protein
MATEFSAIGLLGVLILGFVGWVLIMYWTLRLMRYADARWPGQTPRVILVSMLGFALMGFGAWFVVTLVWLVGRITKRRSPRAHPG